MRPGHPIRLGVVHAGHGTRWLFRGFVDAMTPTYDPVEADSVEFACIDALGEISRAKLPQLATPAFAGDRIDVRIGRILDAALWPTRKRDLAPASDTVIATDLGGQVADLLGQTADSGGGSVFTPTTTPTSSFGHGTDRPTCRGLHPTPRSATAAAPTTSPGA
jgi:hypothetical protein